ncbi:hypothetical protein [Deferribacter desulfuricans]|uniref:hypothetical protein n=1 Tax=Deferribacter desulfuricans TaxID=197162 RepID=UPI0003030DF6|nr:hypothetical protein [Deferribacter desulfuricans]
MLDYSFICDKLYKFKTDLSKVLNIYSDIKELLLNYKELYNFNVKTSYSLDALMNLYCLDAINVKKSKIYLKDIKGVCSDKVSYLDISGLFLYINDNRDLINYFDYICQNKEFNIFKDKELYLYKIQGGKNYYIVNVDHSILNKFLFLKIISIFFDVLNYLSINSVIYEINFNQELTRGYYLILDTLMKLKLKNRINNFKCYINNNTLMMKNNNINSSTKFSPSIILTINNKNYEFTELNKIILLNKYFLSEKY